MITVDALNRQFMGGHHPTWSTSPTMEALMAEGTTFEHVQTVRGLTSIALASLLSGAYPRHTGIRRHDSAYSGGILMLQRRFQEAGWWTIGLSGNQCQYLEEGFDVSFCTEVSAPGGYEDQALGDERLVEEFVRGLDDAPAGAPVFAWIHFMDPHDPYFATPHVTEFYPYVYTGELNPGSYDELETLILDEQDPSSEELQYLEAVYASQVRGVDDRIGFVRDHLESRGLLDASVIALGVDHGEELFLRNHYPYHGCSLYQDVLDVTWSVRAPGLMPAGETILDNVSIVDIAPTLTELSGLSWEGLRDGVPLTKYVMSEPVPARAVYFERDPETAGIVQGGYKYFLTKEPQYASCEPFVGAGRGFYTTPTESLFDLNADPLEQNDLVPSDGDKWFEMRAALCGWILGEPWLTDGDDSRSPLVAACRTTAD
jgi:arylsulfatase A-like enzyme